MKTKDPIPKTYIDALLKERGMHANELAEMIDVSTSYMSKLRNNLAPVTPQLAHKIGNALGVDPNKVVDLPFAKRFTASCDEALLGSALGWICEAAEKHKVKLSHQDLSHWASYVYKGALEESLNFQQTKYLAYAVVDIIRQVKG
jgi:transcriptional regulator with XRE-family HTH domain